MIQHTESPARLEVPPAEYIRLLGYPPGHTLSGRAAELAAWAADWFQRHARPWFALQQASLFQLSPTSVTVDGAAFSSARLQRALSQASAHAAVLAAVSAGPEAEAAAQQLWREEKPDEYFFLEVYASAAVEHLLTLAGAHLCALSEPAGVAVLPHFSPGYEDWDVAEQPRLLSLLGPSIPLEALHSGALRPKKSQLALFGLTRDTHSLQRLANLVPCSRCSLAACQFRRKPFRQPRYSVNAKALRRWMHERLTLHSLDGGLTRARFRYDGNTCNDQGRPLAFDYEVTLGPAAEGFPIHSQRCAPAPGDSGYLAMCQFALEPALLQAIAADAPLLGRPLDAIFDWQRPASPAACYCHPESRLHKWGLVLETIHFALHQRGTYDQLR